MSAPEFGDPAPLWCWVSMCAMFPPLGRARTEPPPALQPLPFRAQTVAKGEQMQMHIRSAVLDREDEPWFSHNGRYKKLTL